MTDEATVEVDVKFLHYVFDVLYEHVPVKYAGTGLEYLQPILHPQEEQNRIITKD